MGGYLIKGASIVNEGRQQMADLLIEGGRISKVANDISPKGSVKEINADGLLMMPGIIDDQVHFREPGLTHKGEIYTESRAAVAGGITSYMEMPNTVPN
ncbi:MAG: dihydroorotase, partial [Flavobacteriales bacterium]|nr:dihydroorotase [Flavobacteriales bacterium]